MKIRLTTFLMLFLSAILWSEEIQSTPDNFNYGINFSMGGHVSDYYDTEVQVIEGLEIIGASEYGLPVYFNPEIYSGKIEAWSTYKVIHPIGIGVHYEFHNTNQSNSDAYGKRRRNYITGHGGGLAILLTNVITKNMLIQSLLLPGISHGTLNRFALLQHKNDRQKYLYGDDYVAIDEAISNRKSALYLKQVYATLSINFCYSHEWLSLGIGPFYRFSQSEVKGNHSKDYPDESNIHEYGLNLVLYR